MEEQTLAAQLANFASEFFVPVLAVSRNAVPCVARMHPNLVSASGYRFGLDRKSVV